MGTSLGFHDGYLYFATDTGHMYLDYIDQNGQQVARAMVGGVSGGSGNSGIYYANREISEEEQLEDIIDFPKGTIEGNDYPQKDDIIINISEGSFYRVIEPLPLASSVKAFRLTIAGGGGGVSTLEEDIALRIEPMESINLINGQSAKLYFTATSAKDKKGEEIDSMVTISYTFAYTEDRQNYITYRTGNIQVASGVRQELEVGLVARASSATRVTLIATQANHKSSITREARFTTSDLTLSLDSSFSNLSVFSAENFTIICKAAGKMDKKIEFYCDNPSVPFYTEDILYNPNEDNSEKTFSINVKTVGGSKVSLTPGNHEIWIKLFQLINGEKGDGITPLHFEVGISSGTSMKPIIWLGEYKKVYYNYDVIQIPYRVYNPATSGELATVHFKKNGRELENSPLDITDHTKFSYFEIADAELGKKNHYTISCGEEQNETIRTIEFEVQVDPTRSDFGIQKQEFLTYNFNSVGSGRSNNETLSKRQTLKYTYQIEENGEQVQKEIKAIFNNFNWYNNGWMRGTDNRTCLRISNGASLTIPIGNMVFAQLGSDVNSIAHTIEMQFKIRNIQNYSNLIRNITRYNNDTELFNKFYEDGVYKTKYTNYDSFLTWYLREENPKSEHPITILDEGATEPRLLEYDDLVYSHIQKQIDLNNAFCSYYTQKSSSEVVGLCLGPQDMFFSNGKNTISASYVEDEMVSLSIVYQHGSTAAQKLIMIYVNGILTSVIKNDETTGFSINADSIVFNSTSCDIDLYKLRVYRTALSVSDIVMNYAADVEKVEIYDQNKLAEMRSSINEYQFKYEKMIDYNALNPNNPLMPYIIFDTTKVPETEQKLSYAKSNKLTIGVEFINTPLELAYSSGELEELAGPNGDKLWKEGATAEQKAEAVKKYYKYHCPSWISDFTAREDEIGPGVQMAVQGTSSEFYPRRNYKLKTKTKDSDGKERIHIFLHKGPFKADFDADRFGVDQPKFILDNSGLKAGQVYYTDDTGSTTIELGGVNAPYEYNKYYVKNPAYVERGKEKTRQKYWYMNNYTMGTTKFTMKIDYMESSGSYNMGFANLVNNAYTKHPLEDYNKAGAFQVADSSLDSYNIAENYKEGTTYYYKDENNNFTAADGKNDHLNINSAETFETASTDLYTLVPGYKAFEIPNTNDYRTSVAGFRVLAFHKKLLSNGEIYYQYIGMYNMLLDKGSDEAFGFKPDKTSGASPLQKFLKNKKISKIAECWEMENNNRTYCSFRDPDKRKDLTFDAFEIKNGKKVRKLSSTKSAPLVADSFEYRYNNDSDALDYIMDPEKEADKLPDETFRFNKDNPEENQETRAQFLLDKYKNWEKACQWVWSTCTDYVPSQGDYVEIKVGKKEWEPNKYYLMVTDNYELDTGSTYDADLDYYQKLENNTYQQIIFDDSIIWRANTYYIKKDYIKDTGVAWDSSLTYYEYDDENKKYINAYVVDGEHLFNNTNKINFYMKVNNEYISCANESAFNESIEYYKLVNFSDEQMAALEAQGKVDRLVRKTTADDIFDSNEFYYTYDGTQVNGQATQRVIITEEEFNAKKGTDEAYYIGYTETKYPGKTYKYDTKEYRGDKFINELKDHFDLEYVATYFVMTEVLECYDSRGKNCMMASWGPQKQGGDYIWYPIFYDIDTQLGVNNTGIPSFDYNVDATEDGNYSTSDSVLWNNFYKYFKSSYIIGKYKHLRGSTTGLFDKVLNPAPLRNENIIEGWYNADPTATGQIVMRGIRPIIAQNLDEYYKYITITNGTLNNDGSQLYQDTMDGIVGHLASNTSGDPSIDDGKFFYMLQGNRSLSRRQFVKNRLEYIDSWLNQGDYQRAGNNRIQGRVAANNALQTSDIWVEDPNDENQSYYLDKEETKKRHLFDSEYWLTLTPTHSTYVTYGDDNEAYPSKKYDGINPLKVTISAIESGVRSSKNYPEQLLYIYGMNHMSDLGDMSKLYWQEFNIIGDASKLTRLQFGYDGVAEETKINPITQEEEIVTYKYKNANVNNPNFAAGKDSGGKGLPLLKYMNMSNIQLRQGSAVLDLTSCQKLENFRATGSNYSQVKFAEGVALHTLYLPRSIVALHLTEARMLKNLITDYKVPVLVEGELQAERGLYLEGMFEGAGETNIATLNIQGGGLGYDSYKLLKRYYDIRKTQSEASSAITMTNVQWSPYVQVTIDDEPNVNTSYFIDNGHYKLEPYPYTVNTDDTIWQTKVTNGEIYYLNEDISADVINQIDDSALEMFNKFCENNNAFIADKVGSNNKVPEITGIIYINNSENNSVDELTIRNELNAKFPNLTFFFANINQAYTAKFVVMAEDEGNDGLYTEIGSQTIEYSADTFFVDPNTLYLKTDIEKAKQNHDFIGWAATNSISATIFTSSSWSNQRLDENIHTYYFYAICPIHKWNVEFYDNGVLFDTIQIPHGSYCTVPSVTPYRDDNSLPLQETYSLLGYSDVENATEKIELNDLLIINNTKLYTVWDTKTISVYDNVHPEYFKVVGVPNTYGAVIQLDKKVTGKLTIPYSITYNGTEYPVTTFNSNGASSKSDPLLKDITHVFFEKDNNGKTSITDIGDYCFFECTNLQYFEFDAPGLMRLGTSCFQNVHNLRLSSQITGTISTLNVRTFINAFANLDNPFILVDGNVTSIVNTTFRNSANADLSNITLQFGSNDKSCTIPMIISYNNNNPLLNSIYYTADSEYHLVVNKIIIYVNDTDSFWTGYENESYQFDNDKRKTLLSSLVSSSQANNIINVLSAKHIALEDFLEVRQAGS